MSKIFVTSDQHFGNQNIIKYCNRPFADAEHQTEALISNWNSVVSDEDTVIQTGDFIMGSPDNVDAILPRLNGHIILTRGNHDVPSKIARYRNYLDKIEIKDIHYQPYKKLFFVCAHFPFTNPEFLDMVNRDNSEVTICFGHIHDKRQHANLTDNTFNCCVDVTNFTPVDLESIWKTVRNNFIQKGVWKGE